jgi:folate-binding protein YgfZ
MLQSAILSDRAVISVEGTEARAFLQGLVTNDMAECAPGRAIYAGLLTPQGKLLFEFLIAAVAPDHFLLDSAADRADALLKKLLLYRLRSKLTIARTTQAVAALWGGGPPALADGVSLFADPRLAQLGWRAIGEKEQLSALANADAAAYHRHRIGLGVPDSADLLPEQIFPLDAGFEELNGVSFRKGCYVGQEVTSRMKHRGTARRRILIAEGDALAASGTTLEADGRELGALVSSDGRRGLALVRLDRLGEAETHGHVITAGGATVRLHRPQWLRV